MVFIKVFQVTSMMHSMMRRGIENEFDNPGTMTNGFRMDPELINKTDLLHEEDPYRVKSQQRHPGPEDK